MDNVLGRVLYQCREVQLVRVDKDYMVLVAGKNYATESWQEQSFENPMAAWRCFVTVLDSIVSKRLGDMLLREGKNKWTGEGGNEPQIQKQGVH